MTSNGHNGRAARHGGPVAAQELTFFVHLDATPAWRALSGGERQQVIAEQVTPLLTRHPRVTLRWFDAEAWSARPSDVLMAHTSDPQAWRNLFAQLRETSLWTVPYFEVQLIVPTAEQAFVQYAARHGSAD